MGHKTTGQALIGEEVFCPWGSTGRGRFSGLFFLDWTQVFSMVVSFKRNDQSTYECSGNREHAPAELLFSGNEAATGRGHSRWLPVLRRLPITPSSEIMERIAVRLRESGLHADGRRDRLPSAPVIVRCGPEPRP